MEQKPDETIGHVFSQLLVAIGSFVVLLKGIPAVFNGISRLMSAAKNLAAYLIRVDSVATHFDPAEISALKLTQERILSVVTLTNDKVDEFTHLQWAHFNARSIGIFYTDAAGKWTRVNKSILAAVGKEHNEVLGDGWIGIVYRDDVMPLTTGWREAIRHGTIFEGRFSLTRSDDTPMVTLWKVFPVRDQSGKIVSWYGEIKIEVPLEDEDADTDVFSD